VNLSQNVSTNDSKKNNATSARDMTSIFAIILSRADPTPLHRNSAWLSNNSMIYLSNYIFPRKLTRLRGTEKGRNGSPPFKFYKINKFL